jgi:hypothetical protein
MEQLVKVKSASPDGTAEVLRIRESACSGDCHKCAGCGAAKETIVFKADNPIDAQPGDLVYVKTQSAPVLMELLWCIWCRYWRFSRGISFWMPFGAWVPWAAVLLSCWELVLW